MGGGVSLFHLTPGPLSLTGEGETELTSFMTKCGHVALAGLPNVGKSSLMNTLVGEPLAMVSPKAQATRVPVVGLRTDAVVTELQNRSRPDHFLLDLVSLPSRGKLQGIYQGVCW